MFWNNPPVVGVSFEEGAIRIVAVRDKNLLAWATVTVSEDKADDRKGLLSVLTNSLSSFIAANSLGRPGVIINPLQEDLITPTTTMKRLEEPELQNALTWEIERLTGYSPASCLWTHTISNNMPAQDEVEVTIMAIDKMTADLYAAACTRAGATLEAFIPAPWNLTYFHRSSLEYVAFVDLGPSTTNVSVIREGIRFSREIRHGYRNIAESTVPYNSEQAIEDLLKNGVSEENPDSIEIADKIADRLSQTFEFAQRQMGIEITRVCLIGPGACIRGLSSHLAESTNHAMEVLQAAGDFQYSSEDKKRLIWDNHTSYYNALGLACSTDTPRIVAPTAREKTSALSPKALGVYAVTAALVFAVAIQANKLSIKRDIESVQQRAVKLRPSLDGLDRLRARSNNLIQLRYKSEQIINSRIQWSEIVSALSRNLSPDAWLTSFNSGTSSGRETSFTISGYGLDYNAVGETITNLEKEAVFGNITLGSTSTEISSGKPVIRFTITITLK